MRVVAGARHSALLLLSCAALTIATVEWGRAQSPNDHDIVLQGGRVIDPETGLDAIRNIGIREDRIVEISDQQLLGRAVIDVSGLVVAPGFIDLHAHGQTNEANEYQAHDGVTTALELESGEDFLGDWLASRTDHALINFGASVPHLAVRWRAMAKYADQADRMSRIVSEHGLESESLAAVRGDVAPARYEPVAPARYDILANGLKQGLEAGALGIGVPVGYYPGATRGELLEVYRLAAAWQAPIFTHVRGISLVGIQEAIANAAVTGAPLHIVHLNSMALGEIDVALQMVASAQARSLDITTEVYPYTAASTGLASTLFDPGWQNRMDITYRDLQWQETGERLTEETFRAYRQQGGYRHHSLDEAGVDRYRGRVTGDPDRLRWHAVRTGRASAVRRHVRARSGSIRPRTRHADAVAGDREDDDPAGA